MPSPAHPPHAIDRAQPGLGEPDALGAAVVRVRDAGDVAGPLQLPQLPGDVGGLHRQPGRQYPGPQRLALGDVPQDRRGGPVQRESRLGHQTLVLPGPAYQVRDAGEGLLDLGQDRRGGLRHGMWCGHGPSVKKLLDLGKKNLLA